MIITGSVILVQSGSAQAVLDRLTEFPEVTFHVISEKGTDLVVNFEAEDHGHLERLCETIKQQVSGVVDISHVYVNFEDEIPKIQSWGMLDPPSFDPES